MNYEPSRRDFIAHAAGGLVISMMLPTLARGQGPVDGRTLPAAPNAFLRIAPDDSVTVIIKHIEFGQGPQTGLATLAAEELDADWSQMRAEMAPANQKLYANLNMGVQGTGGSSAMANSYYQMRKAGAAARAMLVAAAAKQWGVPVSEITVSKGVIAHVASGRQSGFGAFAEAAAKMPAPPNPKLKDPANFTLIGETLPKLDSGVKSTGEARFTIDMTRPGMVHSAIVHPPLFGGVATNVRDADALAVPGVLAVRKLPQGVAVYAKSTFAAQRGAAALGIDWDNGKAEKRSTETLYRLYAEAVRAPGAEAEASGKASAALGESAKTIEAEYRFPYLAHATMEPNDAVVEIGDSKVDVWMGSQLQTVDQVAVATVLGLKPEQVKIHTMFAGGSFGRRATPVSEFAAEAAAVAKAWGKSPVKHVWSRENDIRGGRYRPLNVHRLRGGLDAKGNIVAWDQVIAIQSFIKGSPFESFVIQNGIDSTAVEGAKGMPYDIPNRRIGLHIMEAGVPTLWWRSVGHTHTGYSVETFLDSLLLAAGKDPVEGRLALMSPEKKRLADVLSRAAEMAKWSGGKAKNGRAMGVAAVESFGSFVAQVAEVSKGADGLPRVHKVWCAVDCGVAINPDVIRAQMEGGIGYGLSAALFSEINLEEGGTVREGNFDSYRSLRISEMPDVEVAIIKSGADPTGVGEPGVPPLAPAVANAWRALTGNLVTQLPFARGIEA